MRPRMFDHERLNVYQRSIQFAEWVETHSAKRRPRDELQRQLGRASLSIPLNIAEGNGRTSPRDRARFFDTARGSAFECAACLDVLALRQDLPVTALHRGKNLLWEIVAMLTAMGRALRPSSEPR